MSVLSLHRAGGHDFSKPAVPSLTLLQGLGVEGDAHCGETVQHRSRLHIKPPPKNLRQVHLIHGEILSELNLKPGDIGENITTRGIALLKLGQGTRLHFLRPSEGSSKAELAKKTHPIVVVTGLRNPCPQIQKFRPGLQEKFIERAKADESGRREITARKAGVMSVVEVGGQISVGMKIVVEAPDKFVPLVCV